MMNNMKVELLYFDGCPSWQSGLQNLHSALQANGLDVSVELVKILDNDDAARKKFLGSPSFRVNCVDLWDEEREVYSMSCRVYATPDKVTLLTLGPLTNVAETLQTNPSLVDHIERIYIMGGAVKVPGNVGASGVEIDNSVAEWNIYVDPYAANVVLQSRVPITLVPLDVTNHVPLTAKFYNRLKSNHTSPEATFVFDVLTQQKAFIESGGYYFWDPLAAAILTDDSLATFQNQNLCVVETEGPESGWTRLGNECPEVRVAVSADGGRFEQLFVDVLNTAAP
jgi:inosine-uridine nucleoside N-ribohydrolase